MNTYLVGYLDVDPKTGEFFVVATESVEVVRTDTGEPFVVQPGDRVRIDPKILGVEDGKFRATLDPSFVRAKREDADRG